MAVSTNLGLYLPTREDYISVKRDLSDNYEIIDESTGMLEKGIAIVVNGDTAPRAISSGDYLFIKNHSTLATGGYHATANIANGAAVTSSNTASDSKGVTNTIKGDIDALIGKTTPETLNIVLANATSTMTRYHAQRIGKMVWFSICFVTSVQLGAESALFRIETSGGTNIAPITQSSTKIVYFINNEMKFYTLQKSDGKYYVVPASTIAANTTVILSGCFVCE